MLIAASIISFIVNLISLNLFSRNKIFDPINNRSSHNQNATRSGGLSIFITLFIISLYFYLQGVDIFNYSIIIPLSLIAFTGIYDDIYNLDFKLKLIFQVIAAKIIIDNGFIIDNFHGTFGIYELNRSFAQVFTIVAITAIINSINFIDGIDGLAISITSLFILYFEFFSVSETAFNNLSLILLFSLLPVLYLNFKKDNKVFLGDCGSLLLGGVVSIYSIYILSQDYQIKNDFDLNKIVFLFSILSYPIVDIIRVTCLRILNKKSPFAPDKNHIHHIILKYTGSHSLTLLIIVLITIILTLMIQIFNYII